jgi:HAE1 family hydrophobic/amphiphilic exporter-1
MQLEMLGGSFNYQRLDEVTKEMTSFAFGLAVVPLVLATGAGANSEKSLGLSVLSGIIASTCLAVLFVPSFFAVLQGLEEQLKARKKAPAVISQTGE